MTGRMTGWCADAPLPGDVRPPPALTRGQPLHCYRIGPLHDRSGEFVIDITDEWLAEQVRVFNALRGKQRVPIDWGHGSALGATPEEAISYGHVVELTHVPGVGMWATPEYTDRGAAIVAESQGVLSTSPEFWPPDGWGEVVDKTSGEVVGRVQMLALALTNRPRQDRMEPACLSEVPAPEPSAEAPNAPLPDRHRPKEEAMADPTAPQAPAASPVSAPTPAASVPLAEPPAAVAADPAVDALKAENDGLKAQNAELQAKVAELSKRVEEMMAEASAGAAKLSERDGATTLLAKRVESLEKRTKEAEAKAAASEAKVAATERDRLLDGYEGRGLFTDAERGDFVTFLYDNNRPAFDKFVAARERAPAVPRLGEGRQTHGAAVQVNGKSAEDRLHEEISAVCLRDKVSFGVAYDRLKADKPALFAEVR